MSAQNETFACVINCMDGRTAEKAASLARRLFDVDHPDMVTEPGVDGILAGVDHPVFPKEVIPVVVENLKRKAEISAKGHGAKKCLIVGHCECAGNPVEFHDHVEHLEKAKDVVLGWGIFEEVRIAAFDGNWELQPL